MKEIGHAIEILLVEDNAADVELTMETLADSKINNHLNVVMDGEEAMSYLNNKGKYKDAMRPDLVLLDLNLPRLNGREVLNNIKQDPNLRSIPVVILTTSHDDLDIINAYSSHANCYITKPVDIEQFSKIVRTIEDFWFTIVKLPPKGE